MQPTVQIQSLETLFQRLPPSKCVHLYKFTPLVELRRFVEYCFALTVMDASCLQPFYNRNGGYLQTSLRELWIICLLNPRPRTKYGYIHYSFYRISVTVWFLIDTGSRSRKSLTEIYSLLFLPVYTAFIVNALISALKLNYTHLYLTAAFFPNSFEWNVLSHGQVHLLNSQQRTFENDPKNCCSSHGPSWWRGESAEFLWIFGGDFPSGPPNPIWSKGSKATPFGGGRGGGTYLCSLYKGALPPSPRDHRRFKQQLF